MTSNTPNCQDALTAFEVLFCRIDENGKLKSSDNAPLPDLGRFLRTAETEALPGCAGAADYLNSLCRTAGDGEFADLLAREVFDALITLNIFPDDLNCSDPESDNAQKLQAAQGYVVANFIRNSSKQNQVLLIMPEGVSSQSISFIGELRKGIAGNLRVELIRRNNSDKLINPAADRRAESKAIDAAIARHSDVQTVILYNLTPSGDSIRYLQIYEQPYTQRAKIIVIGLTNLNDWAARQLREGIFNAMIVTDLTKVSDGKELLPDNLIEVFNSCYVLITRDNLNRNRRYFH